MHRSTTSDGSLHLFTFLLKRGLGSLHHFAFESNDMALPAKWHWISRSNTSAGRSGSTAQMQTHKNKIVEVQVLRNSTKQEKGLRKSVPVCKKSYMCSKAMHPMANLFSQSQGAITCCFQRRLSLIATATLPTLDQVSAWWNSIVCFHGKHRRTLAHSSIEQSAGTIAVASTCGDLLKELLPLKLIA